MRAMIATGMAILGLSNVSASPQTDAPLIAAGCARQFEAAQRADMESFRDYDAETFRDGHHPDAARRTVARPAAAAGAADAALAAKAPLRARSDR